MQGDRAGCQGEVAVDECERSDYACGIVGAQVIVEKKNTKR